MLISFNRICIKIVLMGLLVFMGFSAIAQSEDAKESEETKTNERTGKDKDSLPKPEIKCVFIGGQEKPQQEEKKPSLGKGNTKDDKFIECNGKSYKEATLYGAGDVGLVTSIRNYNEVLKYMHDRNKDLMLYVNGVPMGSDAKLFAVEEHNDAIELMWKIKPGKNSDELWAFLYRSGGLIHAQDLKLALGWGDGTVGPYYQNNRLKIQITDPTSRGIALTFVALLVLLFIWVAWKTDALRDTPLPSWWRDAESIRKLFAEKPKESIDSILKEAFDFYEARDKEKYKKAALAVLGRDPIPVNVTPEELIIGLSLLEKDWKPVPAAFSLGRVQLGMWFLFAVATAVFLRVIYGQLPALDNSILALLGISVATTGMSFAVDRNVGSRPYTPTRGFFQDMLTGFDDKQQIHRYQAVMVNILLLFVGISHVPIFEETWLLFLGISGVTTAAGKAFGENQKPQSSHIPTTASSNAGNVTGGPSNQTGNQINPSIKDSPGDQPINNSR